MILLPLLEERFTALDHPTAPVTIGGHFDRTAHIGKITGGNIADFTSEAVLGAVILDAWTSDDTVQVMNSCASFVGNLAHSSGRCDSMAGVENQFVGLLNQCTSQSGVEEFA